MTVLRQIVFRVIIGCLAGMVIGAISAALLMSASPKDWIETWKTETHLEEHQLAWILWAAVAGVIALLSLSVGGIDLGRRAGFVIWGILCGCVVATALTLFAAWFSDEWPFRVKAPQTAIDIGRNFLLPGFAILGGILGRILGPRLEAKLRTPQSKEIRAHCGSRRS